MAVITPSAMNLLGIRSKNVLDDYALAERQLEQVTKVVDQLFPAE